MSEVCDGGDLFTKIQRSGRLSESDAKAILAKLLFALDYLHNKLGVVHRSICLENILFTSSKFLSLYKSSHIITSSHHPVHLTLFLSL